MSIQTRFLLGLGLVLVASVIVLSMAVLTYTVPRLVQWETREAQDHVRRVSRALDREFEHLLIYAREWSVWDDSFRFVQEPTQEYIDANLGAASFVAATVDLLAYLRDDGQVVWAGYKAGDVVDPDQGRALVGELRPQAQQALRDEHGAAGILLTSKGLMEVAVHQIRDSREQGPPQGMMVVGRLLSDDFMQRLRAQTELDLKIVPVAELPALAGQPDIGTELDAAEEPLVRFISPSKLQLLARLHDLVGQTSLVLGIDLSRAVFLQGRQILTYTILGTVALFFLTLAIAGLLLRRMVFAPVAELARHAFELRNSGEYTRRLNNPRNDEIGKLAQEFDALLDRINAQAEELKRLSFEDALTGLKNRRYFDEQLRSAWALLQRTNQPLSLLILDVDDFKRYNDRYGHQQGDASLHAVAQVVTDVLRRAVDTVARYGGEEFAAILPGTSAEDAQALAERVRTEVMALGMRHETSQVAGIVTVTIGVASAGARSDMEAVELLRLADAALYTGKQSGKNTVVLAPEPGQKGALDRGEREPSGT
ncbi:MAG: hypothetical protein A3H91_01120 [Gammaproteobacteria bacterium RIFCSPLOWO2_02_FULL_61_13]|nr:MAG: hypothetical protein A3H91_01120 [Gammaproteobacteria bacterium RIFCSPLOWO2_02_FULL_61_13]